jgi:hypothetical protein
VTDQLSETNDLQYLKLLEIFHYVWGILSCAIGLIGPVYCYIGIAVFRSFKQSAGQENIAMLFGTLFIAFSLFGFILFETCGLLSLLAGRKYRKLKHYRFCFFVSIINCFVVPVGTALGAFSILVLNRPSVKVRFAGRPMRY